MTNQAHNFPPSDDPVIAAIPDRMVQSFCSKQFSYRGWTYVIHHKDQGVYRYDHYAVCGSVAVQIDYTSLETIPKLVFEWLVQMDFPSSKDLPFCTHFEINTFGPMTKMDVERMWLWHRVKDLAA